MFGPPGNRQVAATFPPIACVESPFVLTIAYLWSGAGRWQAPFMVSAASILRLPDSASFTRLPLHGSARPCLRDGSRDCWTRPYRCRWHYGNGGTALEAGEPRDQGSHVEV